MCVCVCVRACVCVCVCVACQFFARSCCLHLRTRADYSLLQYPASVIGFAACLCAFQQQRLSAFSWERAVQSVACFRMVFSLLFVSFRFFSFLVSLFALFGLLPSRIRYVLVMWRRVWQGAVRHAQSRAMTLYKEEMNENSGGDTRRFSTPPATQAAARQPSQSSLRRPLVSPAAER